MVEEDSVSELRASTELIDAFPSMQPYQDILNLAAI
jgi:hypothetical protein